MKFSNEPPNARCYIIVLRAICAIGLVSAARAGIAGMSVPLEVAVDTPGRVWRTGAADPWFGVNFDSHDTVDAARSGGEVGAAESWLETTVTGPVRASGWVRNDDGGVLEMLVDGTVIPQTAADSWQPFVLHLSAGSHVLRWVHRSGTQGTAAGLDAVSFTPITEVSISAGMDFGDGATVWSTQDAVAMGWVDAAEVGVTGGDFLAVRSSSKPLLETSVMGPARVSFRWRIPQGGGRNLVAETGAGRTTVYSPAVNNGWQLSTVEVPAGFTLPPGPATLRLTTDVEAAELLLDDLQVTSMPSLADALGTSSPTWGGPDLNWNAYGWTTRLQPAAAGGTLAASGSIRDGSRWLSTSITGPVEVAVVSSIIEGYGDAWSVVGPMSMRLDGQLVGLVEVLENGWYRTVIFVPEGPHQLLTEVTGNAISSGKYTEGLVDEVVVTALATATLSAALENPQNWPLSVTGRADEKWRALQNVSHARDQNALVCGPLAAGHSTDLTASVTGPGEMLFSARNEHFRYLGAAWEVNLTVSVDGVPALTLGGDSHAFESGEWKLWKLAIPAGAHNVTFHAEAPAELTGGILWLDSLGFLPASLNLSNDFAAATGSTGVGWTQEPSTSGGGWRTLAFPGAKSDGSSAVCMGPMLPDESATLKATVIGPGRLKFSWGNFSEGDPIYQVSSDELTCSVDGVTQGTCLPRSGYQSTELVLPAGPHELTWTLTRHELRPEPPAPILACVDNVVFIPTATGSITPAALADALDVTSNVTTDAVWPWAKVPLSFSPVTASGGSVDTDAAYLELPTAATSYLDIPVTGPGRFGLWMRCESGAYNPTKLYLDGIEASLREAYIDSNRWSLVDIAVAAGPHVLRVWSPVTYAEGSLVRDGVRKMWLTGFGMLPEISLAEALDAPTLAWTVGNIPVGAPAVGWTGLVGDGTTDDVAVTTGILPLTTTVTGPAVVSFDWKDIEVPLPPTQEIPIPPTTGTPTFGEQYSLGSYMVTVGIGWYNSEVPSVGQALFAVDGATRARLNLTTDRYSSSKSVNVTVGPGTHTLTWARSVAHEGHRLEVNRVSVIPVALDAPAVALGVASDKLGFGVTGAWSVDPAVSHDGVSAVRSPDLTNNRMEVEIDGPGEFTYWWRGDLGAVPSTTPAASAFATLEDSATPSNSGTFYYLNRFPVLSRSSNFAWEQQRLVIGYGHYRMVWGLNQPTGGTNHLWVDEVHFTPATVTSAGAFLGEAMDHASLTWTASGGWQKIGGNYVNAPTDDALVGDPLAPGQEAWVETNVTGPKKIRYWQGDTDGSSFHNGRALLDGSLVPGSYQNSRDITVDVPSGPHMLRILFSNSAGESFRPVLDRFRIQTTLAEALDTSGLTWTGNWEAWTTDDGGRDDAAFIGNVISPALRTTVHGSELQFDAWVPAYDSNVDDTIGDLTFAPVLQVRVSGIPVWISSGPTSGWETIRVPLSGVDQTVSWLCPGNTNIRLDHVVVLTGTPAPIPTLAEAMDTPGRVWTGDWRPYTIVGNTSHDDAVASTLNPLTTVVAGPAWVQFDYIKGNDTYTFDIDGRDAIYLGNYYDSAVWKTSQRFLLPPGNHTLKWQTVRGFVYPNDPPLMPCLLDKLVVEPLTTIPLSTALDTTTAWTSSTVVGVSVSDAAGGSAAVFSGVSDNPTLNANIVGPVTFEYRWRPDEASNSNYSYHMFTLDGNTTSGRNLSTNGTSWNTVSWQIPAGAHAVSLVVRPQYYNSTGASFLVDAFTLTPAPSLGDVLNCPSLNFTTSGNVMPRALANGERSVILDSESSINTVVTGPGELSLDLAAQGQESQTPRFQLWVDDVKAGFIPDGLAAPFLQPQQHRVAVSAGSHTIRLNALIGSSVGLDKLCWTPGIPAWAATLGGLADGPNSITAWVTGGNAVWDIAPGVGPGGIDTLQSGPGSANYSWLQAILPRPGTLCYWAQQQIGPNYWANQYFTPKWSFYRDYQLLAGASTLWNRNTGNYIQLTHASFAPASVVSLTEALDSPALTWTSTPPDTWVGQTSPSHEGDSIALGSKPTTEATTTLETTVTGPGRFRFVWQSEQVSDSYHNVLPVFTINGQSSPLHLSSSQAWSPEEIYLSAGPQVVQWMIYDSVGTNNIVFKLDAVHFTPSPVISLTEALDLDQAVWTTSPEHPWHGYGDVPAATGDGRAAVSGDSTTPSWVQTTVTGSGTLRFTWGVPYVNASQRGTLRCYVDGVEALVFRSDETETKVWAMGPGEHIVRWHYLPSTLDKGAWLDNVSFQPGTPTATWGDSIGQPGLTFSGGGMALPFVAGGLLSYIGSLNNETRVHTRITGPAWISYDDEFSYYGPQILFKVDGNEPAQQTLAGKKRYFVGSGNHELEWRWQWLYPYNDTGLALAHVAISPIQEISLAEALDNDSLTFTKVSGDCIGVLSGIGHDGHDGTDALELYPPLGGRAELGSSVTGPGVLRFWWRPTTTSEVFLFAMDGVTLADANGSNYWTEATVVIPPGTHNLSWSCPAAADGSTGGLDAVVWTPTPAGLTVAAAAKISGLTNVTYPADSWFPIQDDALFPVGGTGMVCRPQGDFIPLQADCSGPGTLHFRLKVIDPNFYYGPTLWGNGGQIVSSMNGDWQEFSVFISGPDTQHLEWRGGLTGATESLVYLTELTFTPAPPPISLAIALDQPSMTFTTGSPADGTAWQGYSTPTGINGNLAATQMPAEGAAGAWVETTLIGPGYLNYADNGRTTLSIDGQPPSAGTLNSMPVISAGSHSVRWTVTYFAGASSNLTLDDLKWYPSNWSSWQANRFPTNIPIAKQTPTADPDHDGISNIIEAALDTDPLHLDAAPVKIGSEGGNLYVEVRLGRYLPVGLLPEFEFATSLNGPWAPRPHILHSGTSITIPIQGDPSHYMLRTYFDAAPTPVKFARLRVVGP